MKHANVTQYVEGSFLHVIVPRIAVLADLGVYLFPVQSHPLQIKK